MAPITMMRNALGVEEGGSGVALDREAYQRSVAFWENNANWRPDDSNGAGGPAARHSSSGGRTGGGDGVLAVGGRSRAARCGGDRVVDAAEGCAVRGGGDCRQRQGAASATADAGDARAACLRDACGSERG
ncbi:hypothetical protein G6F60_014031 [Rhizopus arrhizus]|nr:hypothetical protein G6F60_014031 [Rhizopus arrhizus]